MTTQHLIHATPTRGLMFIGDPHVWSHRPGRRRDDSYLETIINKLVAAAHISNATQTWPLILGDLFDKPHDHDPRMLIPLTRALQLFERKPMTLVGNHDKSETRLTERNALRLLEVTGQIHVMDDPGLWATIDLEGEDGTTHRTLIGGTPYGAPLTHRLDLMAGIADRTPDQIREDHGAQTVVWLTHDDLAFEGAYPNSQPLIDIAGIDILVNGHMHGTKRPVGMGQTAYYNPGNISRMSVDMADHVPQVWTWKPFANPGMASTTGVKVPEITGHILPHRPGVEVFDFEGRHAKVMEIDEAPTAEISAFVALIKQEQIEEKTDEAVFVRESLARIWETQKTPEGAQNILARLLAQAIDRQHSEH
jgi:hypothetical protein